MRHTRRGAGTQVGSALGRGGEGVILVKFSFSKGLRGTFGADGASPVADAPEQGRSWSTGNSS